MRKVLMGSALLSVCVATAIASYSSSPVDKIDSFLLAQFENENEAAPATYPILVMLKEQANLDGASALYSKEEKGAFVYRKLVEVATSTQGPIIAYAESKGLKHQAFYINNMVAIFGATEDMIKELAARKDVAKVLNNGVKKLINDTPTLALRQQNLGETAGIAPNIAAVNAPKVWEELKVTGKGIVVAGQDTGVDWTHPALQRQYRGFDGTNANHDYQWHDAIREPLQKSKNRCGYDLKAPCDDGDHGTHTMGTMVGSDGKGNDVGMAPEAKWIACRNMDDGFGRPTTYIDCFQFFLAPFPVGGNAFTQGKPELAPHVINNSWGCPKDEGCTGDEVLGSLRALKAAGVMVVVSAGNSGSTCSTISDPPAYHSADSLRVGAVDHKTWKIAYFSSRGPSTFDKGLGPDITAPGVNVRSTVPGGRYEEFMWSGTSMAGPHVAGLVALMWQANPGLVGKIDETSNYIRKSATPAKTAEKCGGIPADTIPNNTFGHGIIEAMNAVKAVRN